MADGGDTAARYRAFAEFEAAGSSLTYERLAHAVADDRAVIARLDALPKHKRQPNLLFATARLLDLPLGEDATDAILERWDDVHEVMRARSTQTNEAARTAVFAPLIAALDGPIALVEVGCSAGLCLYPDRYAISDNGADPAAGSVGPRIAVDTEGRPPEPSGTSSVVARIGLDLNPLDVTDPDDRTWLRTLIWPEHDVRRARLDEAMDVVAADPPTLVRGDVIDDLDAAFDHVPDGATVVVFHSAVLNYVPRARRREFADAMRHRANTVWISNEGPGVIESLSTSLQPPTGGAAAYFVVGVDGDRVAGISDPHGSWIHWTTA